MKFNGTIARLISPLGFPIIPGLCAGMFLLGVASAIVLPYAPLFALEQVRMTPGQFGLFSAAASLSGVLCSLLIGKWTDSHGRRERWLMVSLTAGSAAYGIYAITSRFAIVLCVAVTLAAIFNAATAQFLALARARLDSAGDQPVDLAMGMVRASFSLAWAIGPAIGALILVAQGFRGIFVTAIALLAGVAAVVLLLPRHRAVRRAFPERVEGSVLSLLANNRVLSACAALCAFSLCSNLTLVALPVHVTRTLSESSSTVGYLFGLAAALEVLLMLVLSCTADRMRKVVLLAAGSTCYALYAAAVSATTATQVLFPLQLLNALATSIFMVTGLTYLQDLVPGRPGIATALFGGALNVGAVLHGPAFALLYGHYGTRAVFLAATALSLLTALPSAVLARGRDGRP